MHITFSEEEATDYIIQNSISLSKFINKSNQEQIINLTHYSSRYAFFGAENPYLFNVLFNYSKELTEVNLKNYMNLTQMNIRINSRYFYLFEFYNLYFNNFKTKINFYIMQLYGGSDLFLCNADDYNERNLQFLTTLICNVKYKNKKSIFNNLFTLDGTKILSRYMTPDSYFDIYTEVVHENEDTNIKINPIMITDLKRTNAVNI